MAKLTEQKQTAKLTEKQKVFADEYLIDLNATRAAIAAGYSEKTARFIGAENLTKPNIQEYIQERMQKQQSERIATQEEVLEYLTSVMRRELKEVVVVTTSNTLEKWLPDENGTMRKQKITKEEPQLVEIPAKLSDANKAAELLGKRYGTFTDKVDVSGALPVILAGENEIPD